MPDQSQRHPTADALLDHAVEIIDRAGEQAVRVEEVSAFCEVSITSLYHHFGNREGLIEAAQAERFTRATRRNIDRFEVEVDAASSTTELRATIAKWVSTLVSSGATDVRRIRAQVLASALTRQRLMDRVIELNRTQFDRIGATLQRAIDRGVLTGDVDPRSAAIAFSCLSFGRIVVEIDPVDGPASEAHYAAFAAASIDQLLFGER